MRRKKLTPTQEKLLQIMSNYIGDSEYTAIEYYRLKNLCYPFPSFDLTFNAILSKGWLKRLEDKNNYYLS